MFNKVTPLSEPTRFDGGSEPVCEVRDLTSESNLGHSQTDLPRSLREFGTATDLGPNVPIGRWQCVERILTTRSDRRAPAHWWHEAPPETLECSGLTELLFAAEPLSFGGRATVSLAGTTSISIGLFQRLSQRFQSSVKPEHSPSWRLVDPILHFLLSNFIPCNLATCDLTSAGCDLRLIAHSPCGNPRRAICRPVQRSEDLG